MLEGTLSSGGKIIAVIDNNGVQTQPEGTLSTGTVAVTEVKQYSSYLEFPNLGNPSLLYIDQINNKSYRWDSTALKYECVGSNYDDINIIEGGNANE